LLTYFAEKNKDWKKWLDENHDIESEVWLVFYKKHTQKINIDYESSVEIALCYGWIDSIMKSVDEDSYVRKFTPRQPLSNWSFINRERALKMLASGEMIDAGMKTIEEARNNGKWYLQKPAIEMPIELEELLDENIEGALFFSELAPSYRKQYMGWVGEGKRPETRKKRAEEAVRLLSNHSKLPLK